MPIQVECPSCRSAFRVGEDAAGKRGKCPRCRETIVVPAAQAHEEDGLVPIEPPAPRPRGREAAAPDRAEPDDDSEGYEVAGAAKKARAVPVREGGAAAVPEGVARAVEAARPTQTPEADPRGLPGRDRAGQADAPVPGLDRRRRRGDAAAAGGLPRDRRPGHLRPLPARRSTTSGSSRTCGTTGRRSRLYVGPIVAGVVVIGFMLKPLFARPGRSRRPGHSTRRSSRSCSPSWTASARRSGAEAEPDRGQLRGQRLGPPRRRPARRLQQRAGPDDRPAAGGGHEPQAVLGRAGPRVRPLLAGGGDAALVPDPVDQLLVRPGRLRARPVGRDARGVVDRRQRLRDAPRPDRPGGGLADPPGPLGADVAGEPGQRVPAPPDGVRRRPLRGADGRRQGLRLDLLAAPRAGPGREGRLRRPPRELAGAAAARQPAQADPGQRRPDPRRGDGRLPQGDGPGQDRAVRHPPVRPRPDRPRPRRGRRRDLPPRRPRHRPLPQLRLARPRRHVRPLPRPARPRDPARTSSSPSPSWSRPRRSRRRATRRSTASSSTPTTRPSGSPWPGTTPRPPADPKAARQAL